MYLYAEFVKDCLKEKVNVLTELAISLLKGKINKGIEEGRSGASCMDFQKVYKNLLSLKRRLALPVRIELYLYL